MTSASRTIGTKTKEAIADFEQKDGMPVNGRWRREIPNAADQSLHHVPPLSRGIDFAELMQARLAELAKRTGRTKSFYAREAILTHLDELEDLYLAESRLDDLLEGRSGSIPLSDLIRRHGVED